MVLRLLRVRRPEKEVTKDIKYWERVHGAHVGVTLQGCVDSEQVGTEQKKDRH